MKTIYLALTLIFILSCSNNEINSKDNFEKKVISSIEYKNYLNTFNKLKEIDLILSEKGKEKIENNFTTKDEFEKNFNNLINPTQKRKTLNYFKSLNIPNIENLLEKREIIFNKEIPEKTIELGTKFPRLKDYSSEQMINLSSL